MLLYGEMLHCEMLYGEMLHCEMLFGEMLHGEMLLSQLIINFPGRKTVNISNWQFPYKLSNRAS